MWKSAITEASKSKAKLTMIQTMYLTAAVCTHRNVARKHFLTWAWTWGSNWTVFFAMAIPTSLYSNVKCIPSTLCSPNHPYKLIKLITFFLSSGSRNVVCDHSQFLLLRFGLFLKEKVVERNKTFVIKWSNLQGKNYVVNIGLYLCFSKLQQYFTKCYS